MTPTSLCIVLPCLQQSCTAHGFYSPRIRAASYGAWKPVECVASMKAIGLILARMTGLPMPAAADRRGCAARNLRQAQACSDDDQPAHYGQPTSEEHRGDVKVVERPHLPDTPTNVLVQSYHCKTGRTIGLWSYAEWPLVQYTAGCRASILTATSLIDGVR